METAELTPAQFAARHGMSVRRVQQMMRSGQLGYLEKTKRNRVILPEHEKEWLKAIERPAKIRGGKEASGHNSEEIKSWLNSTKDQAKARTGTPATKIKEEKMFDALLGLG